MVKIKGGNSTMKKRILSLALTLTLVLALVPVVSAAMMANYTEVVPPKYDAATAFSEGLAGVVLNWKLGFIDKNGNEVIPFIYEKESLASFSGGYFSEGLAAVRLNGKEGYIDKNGKEVIPFIYDFAFSFSEGVAVVGLNGKWGLIDKNGNEITPIKYERMSYTEEGLIAVLLNNKWGFVDRTGREVVPPKYDRFFPDALEQGDDRPYFYNGYAVLHFNGRFNCLIDKTGREVIPPGRYDYVDVFFEGLARVGLNGKEGFVDKMGNEVIPLIYDQVSFFSEGLAKVRIGRYIGFIDKSGNEVLPLIYERGNLSMFGFKNGLAHVTLNGKEIYIDKNGNEPYAGLFARYDYVYNLASYNDNFVDVRLNGKAGLIDRSGQEIVPPIYDSVRPVSIDRFFSEEGLAEVRLNNKSGFIDKSGREVVPPKYDFIGRSYRPGDYYYSSEGLIAVSFNGKWGFISIPTNPLTTASHWAQSHITEAIGKGFLPSGLQNNYSSNITRGDFVTLAMSWLNYRTGLTNEQLVAQYAKPENSGRVFTDTADPVILAAARLDITAGIGNNQFGVDGTFTRQQAAVMLTKVFSILGEDTDNAPAFGFADINEANDWARNAINYVGSKGAMSGTGGGLFGPHGTFTREMSIVTFNNIK
jgi:hypothetical protein